MSFPTTAGELTREFLLSLPRRTTLPIHFFTIVLNGEPFIRHHLEVFKKLPFTWHWHIIEGVADHKKCTSWGKDNGGKIPDSFHNNGLSIDGTTTYLDEIKKKYPDQISVYRKENSFFDGKLEMISLPLSCIKDEVLLFEIDVDELWTSDQIKKVRELFIAHPEKTAAYFYCHYFITHNKIITTKNTYGNNTSYEWLRVWRCQPKDAWASHEPPILAREDRNGLWFDIARKNPFLHEETAHAGLIFEHYAYATEKQVAFKEDYYGYTNAVQSWRKLCHAPSPSLVREYIPWVKDNALCEEAPFTPLLRLSPPEKAYKHSINQKTKILFVRPDSIGDCILSTSTLQHLREHFPAAYISVLCQERTKEVFGGNPNIDSIITFDRQSVFETNGYFEKLLQELKHQQYDIALNSVYSSDELTHLLTLAIDAKITYGLDGDLSNISPELRSRYNSFYTKLIPTSDEVSLEITRMQEFTLGVTGKILPHNTHIVLSDDDRKWAHDIERLLRRPLEKAVIIFTAAQYRIRNISGFGEELGKVLKEKGLWAIGVGSDKDHAWNEYTLSQLDVPYVNLCGEATLKQSAALIERACACIGADTAPGHIAASFHKKNLIIMAGAHWGRFFPYDDQTRVLTHKLPCFGCNYQCEFEKPLCITQVSSSVIASTFRELLETSLPSESILNTKI